MRKKTFHGVTLGILMLRTRFRRWPGDIGHAGTFPFPVQYRVVEEATPTSITELHRTSLLEPFKRAAQALIDDGVDGIATTCGFLSIYQRELAAFCAVPVATSALLQVPMVARMLAPGRTVGILTFDEAALTGPYLEAVGVPAATPITGLPAASEFVRSIRDGDDGVPFAVLRGEVLAAAESLVRRHPSVGAIVCECTNLPPFSADIAECLGLPVFDAVTLIKGFHAALRPPRYST